MRWPLRRRQPPRSEARRLPSLGQDYAEGHRRYVERLGAERELWLRTKPFSVVPSHELFECVRTFAHIVERLQLPLRAQVLDVGCGPGWLSEFLARCGYSVTGVDVSEDMVEIARERVEAIGRPIGPGIEALAEFHAMPVLKLPWTARFDAAVLYDAMHHFDDELETLRVIRRSLVPGGRIFIHEGVRPSPGSEGERELIAEMEEYGTLESPFDADYLVAVLREAGFTAVRRFAAVDELLDVSEAAHELRRIEERLVSPPMNTVVADNPIRADGSQEAFRAQIRTDGGWQISDGELALRVTVTNEGRCYWPAGVRPAFPAGSVTVGPYVRGVDGHRVELPRQPLPRSLSNDESVEVEVRLSRAAVEGDVELGIDLVREGIAWFADYGSSPLVVPLPHPD
ncbi:MAG: class I SAM-dependent methyltransferase [Gaiellaceae bacterium]